MTCVHCQTPLPDGSLSCPACGADSNPDSTGGRSRKADELLARLRESVENTYVIRELLGQGGMGAVYLAVDKKLDREVAIKVLPIELAHDENFVGRFEREARTAAKLDHPGIIPIYAVEGDDDLHYFVMKFVAGRALDNVIGSGPVPVDLTQRILWEAACALGHAHAREVVHRDIKPANIMIEGSGRVVLTDFGISKALQSASQFTATGQVIGTPHYMSPEQAKGEEVAGASDQYSLGIVGYRMLTGRLPFEGDDSVHTIIYKHVFEDPPPIEQVQPDTPPFLAQAIRRAMAKDPAHRFETMEDFATAVGPEQPVEPETRDHARVSARRKPASTEAPTEVSGPTVITAETKRRRAMPLVLVTLFVLLAAGSAFAFLTPAGNRMLEQVGLRAAAPAPEPAETSPVALGDTGVTAATTTPPETTATPAAGDPPQREETPPTRQATQPPAQPTPRPSRPAPSRPAAPRVGFLTVSVSGGWMTVFVDRVEVGETPVFEHELPVGTHIVELRREGYVTIVDTVEIIPGQRTRMGKTAIRSNE